ncbi:ATPase, V1 complex, subunit H [Dissoconium aciculare CBS 342.82]|jgi:V-type H+-transporting ATPase subunit H|uniref:V-type proton ATPase subunit H n=1 Tax=Dissoconium aciculare CBS 342.82 TaxID=1314786 RepID=A0A6J3MFD3_9PEZI|nr:ATPase, V1 complex, subunit H [Dissoconium aciculare CBS 342.82]KAF1826553.1 ATPase, V1 complex, subunit H [Dissoconium aciculare CBS 342.82]
MFLNPPEYLVTLQSNVRARPISWEGAVRAKTLSEADLKKIRSIDKVRKEQRKQTIEADVQVYTDLLLGNDGNKSIFESAVKRTDIVQYMLVLTGDLIDDVPALSDSLVKHAHPFQPFLPLLKQSSNSEDPIPLLASSVLTSILAHAIVAQPKSTPEIHDALPKLYSYIATLSNTSDADLQDIAVQEYSAMLRTVSARKQFWDQRKETLTPLVEVLRKATGGKDSDSTVFNGTSAGSSIRTLAQSNIKVSGVSLRLLYHILLVVWQLSFEGELVGKGLDEEHDIIPLYTQLVRVSPTEKTTRLLLATLNNLLSTNKATLMPAALPARLPYILTNLKSRNLTDPDLLEDLDNLVNMVEEYTKTQTTFDEYSSEVQSGHLRWSPPHKDQAFWRENALRVIEENKGELCRKLAEILGKDWQNDKQVLAIGCSDVAYLVKECPTKRQQLEKFGLKTRIMALMQDENETVRWESLRAVGEWLRYSFDSQ